MTPGIHSMPAEQYHAAEGVSRSMLESIASPKTPAHYHCDWIEKKKKHEDSKALIFGTLSHRSVFEADTMEDAFYVKPEGMSFAKTEGKEWREAHTDRPILSGEEAEAIPGIYTALMAHPSASKLIVGAEFERSAFADYNGLLIKSRFDCLPKSGPVQFEGKTIDAGKLIVDLKTITSSDDETIENDMWKFGYYRQAAFYLLVAKLLDLKRTHFVFVFAEKTSPYAVACKVLTDDVMGPAHQLIASDLFRLRQCIETNKWPAREDDIKWCALPPYAMKQIEALV